MLALKTAVAAETKRSDSWLGLVPRDIVWYLKSRYFGWSVGTVDVANLTTFVPTGISSKLPTQWKQMGRYLVKAICVHTMVQLLGPGLLTLWMAPKHHTLPSLYCLAFNIIYFQTTLLNFCTWMDAALIRALYVDYQGTLVVGYSQRNILKRGPQVKLTSTSEEYGAQLRDLTGKLVNPNSYQDYQLDQLEVRVQRMIRRDQDGRTLALSLDSRIQPGIQMLVDSNGQVLIIQSSGQVEVYSSDLIWSYTYFLTGLPNPEQLSAYQLDQLDRLLAIYQSTDLVIFDSQGVLLKTLSSSTYLSSFTITSDGQIYVESLGSILTVQ